MQVRVAVFDIGNVLISWDPPGFYDQEIGPEGRQALFAEVDLQEMNLDLDRGFPFSETVERWASAHPRWTAEIRMWHDRWIDFTAPGFPGTVRLLRSLRKAGVPVFALSNFGVEPYEIAAGRYPFLREFDRMYLSGALKAIKPDAEIYAALETDSGAAPETLLFVDDRPENVEAALARGWHAHLFDGPDGLEARLVAEGLLTKETAQ